MMVTMLASEAEFYQAPWFHLKLTLVLLMTATHFYFWRWQVLFEKDGNDKADRFFRVWNEIPTLLMIFIVGLVIIKPY